VNIVDSLNGLWQTILGITEKIVIPDWSSVIGLLPLLIFVGIVGPLMTFVMLGIVGYQLTKPRPHLKLAEGPQLAGTGADGQPIFPPGRPFCRAHALIHPTGTIHCERGGEDLSVICPMCALGRPATIDTCPNCGLVLNVKQRPVPVVRTNGPKPGGAALA